MSATLTKASFTCREDGSLDLVVQFNPTSLKLARKANWSSEAEVKQGQARPQFGGCDCDTLSMQLLFDTTETADSILPLLKQVHRWAYPVEFSEQDHRPPLLEFCWNEIDFEGVVTSLDTEILMFQPDGQPKRANVSLSLMGRGFTTPVGSAAFFGAQAPPEQKDSGEGEAAQVEGAVDEDSDLDDRLQSMAGS